MMELLFKIISISAQIGLTSRGNYYEYSIIRSLENLSSSLRPPNRVVGLYRDISSHWTNVRDYNRNTSATILMSSRNFFLPAGVLYMTQNSRNEAS